MAKNILKECPSEEELNAWYDSELRDPVIEDHLTSCSKCRKVLRSYLEIDSEIQGNLCSGYDPKMAFRIKSRSMARIAAAAGSGFYTSTPGAGSPPVPLFLSWFWFFAIASANSASALLMTLCPGKPGLKNSLKDLSGTCRASPRA